ncbi:MAG: hypothetical protein F9K13_13405 [Candidatus Methylomirabilis oxygeniifera]|nr:MAG: hypothetical protein F9K13_13405 [Candidatus Methylomirabilis oxyfera]
MRSYTTGRRFENAVRAELAEAKELIDRKMRWILRDETGVTPESRNPSHVVACYGRLLYLGEPEDFSVHLPFWEQNIRAIVEVTPAKPFAALFQEIVLVNKFLSKFRDMKLAFTSGLGDPKGMAVACLEDLISIHDQLIPGQALARTLSVPLVLLGSSAAAKQAPNA